MKTKSLSEQLRRYNRWRRGDERLKMPDPKALGDLIDTVADRLEVLEFENYRFRNAIQLTLDENGHLADGDACTLIELKHAITHTPK
jgi:hypothetical protein